jgi:hypothetical protein
MCFPSIVLAGYKLRPFIMARVRNVFSPLIPKPVKNVTFTNRINVFMSWPSVFWKANGASLSLLRPGFQSQVSTYGIFG